MRFERLVIAAVAASICAAAGASPNENPYGGGTRLIPRDPAQIPTGSMSQQDKARILTLRVAACLIKDHRGAVLNAIKPEPWQRDAGRMLVSVVDDRCLDSGELSMPHSLLRGAFFEVFYRERFGAGPPTLPSAMIDFAAQNEGTLSDEAKTDIALRQFGDCVARRDLRDSHTLVLSAPGSAEETAAINALAPHFGACVVQGSKWTLNRSSVSAILSEVLYREAVAAEEPQTGQ